MPRLCHVLDETVCLLTCLINNFISNRQWPTIWKRSNIVLVFFKKEWATDKTCYRPVSVLTALSKLYELMFHQMYEAFYSRLSPNISGYLKGHLCCTALLKISEDWRASLDIREAVTVVAVDLTKAFDSVCHPLLLAKLKAYGFTDGLWNLSVLIF